MLDPGPGPTTLQGVSVSLDPIVRPLDHDHRRPHDRLSPTGLDSPIAMASRVGRNQLWIAERDGRVRILSIDTTWDRATGKTKHTGYTLLPGAALDISSLTTTDGERGLLGIAFSTDGRTLYVDHTATNGDIQVASYAVEDQRAFSGGDGVKPPQASTVVKVDPASRQTLLTIPHQQASNHNGGQLVLGPDGYLYVGVGDGGGAGDTAGNAQNTDTLLGKILRIDPAGAALGSPYAIPADNPFVAGGGRPEIFLYGVRNPWRFSFDSVTGDLWVADVGQGAVEEINWLPASAGAGRGANLGWNWFEGDTRLPHRRHAPRGDGLAAAHLHPRRRPLLGHRRLRVPRHRGARPRQHLRLRRLLHRRGPGPARPQGHRARRPDPQHRGEARHPRQLRPGRPGRAVRALGRRHPVQGHRVSAESIRVTETIDLSGDSRPRWRRGRQLSDGSRIYWWKEMLIVLVVDVVYETVRNIASAKPQKAYDNAIRLIGWQRDLGIWHEHGIQQWALGFTPMIIAANYFYGSVYIVATVLGLVFLYRFHSDDYPLWRNALAIGTLLGLIGFATFPLMPPRLLDSWADPNGLFQFNADTFFHFKDTLLEYPTFWSFDSEGMKSISNQFAAMPSLHCAWAFWGLAVFYPRVKSWWGKSLAILYPITTIYVVVITGNHYFLDAVGGLLIMVVGYSGARLITRSGRGPKIVHTPSEELADIDVSDGGPHGAHLGRLNRRNPIGAQPPTPGRPGVPARISMATR